MIGREAIQAKSDQMNATDLIKPTVFQIERAEYKPKEKKVYVWLVGEPDRPYKPSLGMTRGLVKYWGQDETLWAGKFLQLYCDPDAMYAGVKVGGIRISAVSGIPEDVEFILTLGGGKRMIWKFKKIPDDYQLKGSGNAKKQA